MLVRRFDNFISDLGGGFVLQVQLDVVVWFVLVGLDVVLQYLYSG